MGKWWWQLQLNLPKSLVSYCILVIFSEIVVIIRRAVEKEWIIGDGVYGVDSGGGLHLSKLEVYVASGGTLCEDEES